MSSQTTHYGLNLPILVKESKKKVRKTTTTPKRWNAAVQDDF
jgi:hypothetical protein